MTETKEQKMQPDAPVGEDLKKMGNEYAEAFVTILSGQADATEAKPETEKEK